MKPKSTKNPMTRVAVGLAMIGALAATAISPPSTHPTTTTSCGAHPTTPSERQS